jgi:outer membrane lipoprotein
MAVTWTIRCVAICLILVMFGCATGISRETRSQVTYKGTFGALQKAPDKHRGETVMLGGRVVETKGSQASSEITVLQLPLDTSNRPKDSDQSGGRYIVRTKQFLDPAIYQAGSLLTVVGRVTGSEVRSIGGFQYVYPLVEAIEIKPWPAKGRKSPSFHFGIGVGTWL